MAEPAVTQEVAIAESESKKISEVTSAIRIRKDADLTEATKAVSEVKRMYKNIDEKRKGITAPLRTAIKEVDELFKNPLARLKDAELLIKKEMIRYSEKVEKAALKKAEAIETKVDSGQMEMSDAMGKLGNIKQAETRVESDSGSAQFKTVTRIRIINPADLPGKYFIRDRVLEALRIEVEEDVRKKAEPVPAGAESYEERIVAVRS